MSSLIVLGLIPGTHIQITFLLWSIVAGGLAAYIIARQSYRTETFRAYMVATYITVAVRREIQ